MRPLRHAGVAALLAALAATASASPAASAESYCRYDPTHDAGDFRTLIRTFTNPYTGDTVAIMGTIHLADDAFYARFNAEIQKADLVLMEGVGGSPGLATLPLVYQGGLAHRLIAPSRLAAQGEMVPSDAPQCVNADVTLDALSPGWAATLGSLVALPFVAIGGECTVVLQSLGDYGARLTGNGGAYAAWHRATLAAALTNPEASDFADADLIITKRNAVVMEHLDAHIANDTPGRVLIPWGAAHGPGLEKGLRARGYAPIADEWVTAIAVASYEKAGYTTPENAYRFHLPLLFSIRGSDTTLSHSGPLWLWHDTQVPAGRDASIGWLLFNTQTLRNGDAGTSALAGLAYRTESKDGRSGSLWLAGLLRFAESDARAHTAHTHHLLALHATESDPEHTRVRLGWWGSIFDHTEKPSGDGEASVLPHLFGRPLLYDSKTENGETRRRFLLFFET